MLRSLNINNVVLIDKLDLDFGPGFIVLTGETGAGKSILLDALGLVLGRRAETSLIRQGADKLSVTAVFDKIDNPEFVDLLKDNDLEVADEIMIKRTLSASGAGKIFFNDQPISAKLLKEIGKYLVEIHGQFDNQGLLNPANHRAILDAFGGYDNILNDCRETYYAYKAAAQARADYEQAILKAKQDEDNLHHWVRELEQVSPRKGEIAELQTRRQELMQSEKIIENLNYAYAALQSSDAASALRSALSGISKANNLVNDKYASIYEALDSALVQLSEATDEIEAASSDIALNATEQDNIDSRIFALKDLARKHTCDVDDLVDVWQKFSDQLNAITQGEDKLGELKATEQKARQNYLNAANTLHNHRVKAAQKLDGAVMAELPPLKMEKAKFITQITSLGEDHCSVYGMDEVCFSVSTNPNSPQGPLNKIASGGELSRFMLALKVNLMQSDTITTMVFDEIDSGIGGAVSRAVGERLARLGQKVQVLVVTHSPQVAALGDAHFKVEKNTIDNITTTVVYELKGSARQEEIARMLSGEKITDEARAAALQLMKK